MDTAPSTLQASSSSTPHFQHIFEKALKEYKKKTGKELTTHPLAAEINGCVSPEAILAILEAKARELDQSQSSNERLTKWLNPTVNILNALSATLGPGVGMVFPPTTIIFSGIGILLVAAKSTVASPDMLVELFERIESFFKRVKTHTEVVPSPELTDALAKIMAEVLLTLAVATKSMKKKWWRIFFKQLVGTNDIRDALQKFDKLEQGELLTVIAQVSTDTRVLKEDTKEIINKMDTRERENFLRSLKRWLSPPEPSTNYELGLHAYHKGTSTWLMEGNIFKEWNATDSLLWIHGKPGSGKSTLCSAIIQRLLSLSDGGRASVAYFYFDFRDEEKKHRRNLLSSLLVQLAEQWIPCSDILSPVYSSHGNGKQPPSDEVLMECLKNMLSASPQQPMYIIMDAVDECPDSSGVRSPRAHVLSFIQELVGLRLANLHICVTSRPEIDIRNHLEPLTSLRLSLHDEPGHKEDIAKYIRSEAEFISHDKRWRDGDKELVIETLSKKADGMFRWVFCQLEMLRLCIQSRVRQFVHALPDGLDETYERVLKGIPKTNQRHVQRVLQCLAVAIRPLRVEELAQILTFDPEGMEGEVANLEADSEEQELLSACPSLITIVDSLGSRVVQFSHFSVKEFLMSGRLSTSGEDISHYHILPSAAHTSLAQVSLDVLLRLDDHVDRWRVKNAPLAMYAAEHWVSHVQVANTSSHIMNMMETLFESDKPHFSVWVRIYDMDKPRWYLERDTATPLYYAALCGVYHLVEYLVKKYPGHVNALGGQHDYPLVAALYKGHIQVANLLLQHGANVDSRGTYGRTPLHQAITRFNETVLDGVQFLLEHGADANSQQLDLRTPLHLAAAWGNDKFLSGPAPILTPTNLVELLLEYGANLHAEDNKGITPLHQVVEGTFISEEASSVVRLLIERGADVNKPANGHQTPLHLASHHQHLKPVQVFLDHRANVNAKDWRSRTPLHQVFEDNTLHKDSFSLVQLLVERGTDVNAQDKDHVTPLHMASYRQKPESVRVLLGNGANVNAQESKGQTPLHRVFETPDTSEDVLHVIRLLVERGAGVNIKDKDLTTPLHLASYFQKLESVRVLLNYGADVHVEDSHHRTPLHRVLAAPYISEEGACVVQLLLERGANVNAPNEHHVTPLHWASYRQKLESVRVLLNHGANVNAKDSHHRTPLHRVLEGRFLSKDGLSVVQLLVERGTDVNTKDIDHITPLHFASYRHKLESVRVLLNHGANVNVEDSHDRTPLHRALERNPISEDGFGVVQLLVKHGANVNTQDKDHMTPLHFASHNQHLESVQVLLNRGANVNVKDSHDQTPLYQALGKPDVSKDILGVVQLLVERGADVTTPNKEDITSLHLASSYHRLEFVRVLLDHGANVNAKDNMGQTPLHRVFGNAPEGYPGDYAIPQILLKHGADVNARDKAHETPLYMALRLGFFEGPWVLLKHGADLYVENSEGMTPFQLFRNIIRDEMRAAPPGYFRKATLAERVVLMSLLHEY